MLFRHDGKQYAFPLGPVSQREAEAKSAQVDYLLLRLKQRPIELPPGMGVVDFVRFDGKPTRGTSRYQHRYQVADSRPTPRSIS